MLVYGTKLTVQLNLHTTTVMLNVRNDVSGNSRVRVLSASNPKLYLLVLYYKLVRMLTCTCCGLHHVFMTQLRVLMFLYLRGTQYSQQLRR